MHDSLSFSSPLDRNGFRNTPCPRFYQELTSHAVHLTSPRGLLLPNDPGKVKAPAGLPRLCIASGAEPPTLRLFLVETPSP